MPENRAAASKDQEDGPGADEPHAAARRGGRVLQRGAALARGGAEVALGHREDEREAESDGQDTADEERQVQGDEAEKHARGYADEGAHVVGLLSTQVDPSQVAVRGPRPRSRPRAPR